jgi:hypothetical protein
LPVGDAANAFHGGALGERVAAIVDAATRDAAGTEAEAERAAREIMRAAHEEAREAFRQAGEESHAAALERARQLAALRLSIAERSESLIAEADDPQHVREQVEGLLLALAETEAELERGLGPERMPAPPDGIEEEPMAPGPEEPAADSRQPAEPESDGAEPNGNGAASDGPFTRWRRGRHDARLLALMRMAVGGMTREQIARELDPALPQEEREALLDDVFGRPDRARRRRSAVQPDVVTRTPKP